MTLDDLVKGVNDARLEGISLDADVLLYDSDSGDYYSPTEVEHGFVATNEYTSGASAKIFGKTMKEVMVTDDMMNTYAITSNEINSAILIK